MLRLVILPAQGWNEREEVFGETKEVVLTLEHSLVSVSKWESKWCVPFLDKREKTSQEVLDYIKCMTLTQNVDPNVYNFLTQDNLDAIQAYIEAPMTATTISDRQSRHNREIITAEIIYYWMVAFNIPFECQKWHLNKLLMLVNVCSIKQEDPKKIRGRELLNTNRALNEKRRAELKSKG